MLCQGVGTERGGSLSIEDDVLIGVHCFDVPCSDPGDLQKNKSTLFLSQEVLAIASMEIGIFGCYLGYLS